MIVIRRRRTPLVVKVEASPPAPVRLVRRGWVDLRGEIRGEFYSLGEVDATSVVDLLSDRRPF